MVSGSFLFVGRVCVYSVLRGECLYTVVLLAESKKIVDLLYLNTCKVCNMVEQVGCCPGDVAQVVERSLRMREVSKSIPCFSTMIITVIMLL